MTIKFGLLKEFQMTLDVKVTYEAEEINERTETISNVTQFHICRYIWLYVVRTGRVLLFEANFGTFAKRTCKYMPVSSPFLSVFLSTSVSTCKHMRWVWLIFMKFDIVDFHCNLSTNSSFIYNQENTNHLNKTYIPFYLYLAKYWSEPKTYRTDLIKKN